MNILIPDSWLREFLETDATPKDIQRCLSLCGPSVERLKQVGKDWVYDIEITTNRVDCMSVFGIAREAAAILPQFDFKAKIKSDPFLAKSKLTTSIKVDYLTAEIDQLLCSHFTAVLINNVAQSPSPDWLAKRLELVGMRSLNNVVDISNYLMHELGQPVHTFDYDKIKGAKMVLRASSKGETLTTLDGKSHTLPGGDIVMADGSEKLIDLCGIMGGASSAVDANTKNVLLFVQTYSPTHIRKTSMTLAHRTQAAVLFEKQLPTESVLPTLARGINLFSQLTGGQAAKTVLDINFDKTQTPKVSFPEPISEFASSRIGIDFESTQIQKILSDLGFWVKGDKEVSPPWWRKYDISIPEDLVEEIARIYGYHNLPSQLMSGNLPKSRGPDKNFYWENRLKYLLKHLGFTETYTYSLVENDTGLKLKNPLSSEWMYLRTSLTPSHQKIIAENLGKTPELNFFEIANVYQPQKNALPIEEARLILSTTNPDYYRFKGLIETIFSETGLRMPEVSIQRNDDSIIWETPLNSLIDAASDLHTYTPISKFTPIVEDINVPYSGNYSHILQTIKQSSDLIQDVQFVDLYNNKLTLRLTFLSNSRQLSDSDVAPIRLELAQLFLAHET